MSGHSKWATIKRQKGVADIKRGAAFTKLSNAISIAARDGGSADPEMNFKLRLSIEKARQANMPKENIQRAIDKGLGKGDKGDLQEAIYEGFAPGGVAVMVECVTDNKLRTLGEVQGVFNKGGGTLGQPGSIAYQFQQIGIITVNKGNHTLDEVFLIAADAGAEDVEEIDDIFEISTQPGNLKATQEALQAAGLSVTGAELSRKPVTIVTIDNGEQSDKLITFLDRLENLDDVQKVYANFDITN